MTENWSQPKEIDGAMRIFPANVIGKILPPEKVIPEVFWKNYGNPAGDCASEWFFRGLKDAKFYSREGIDPNKATRQLGACLSSFEPSHEHKTAGVAYLFALFFSKVEANGKVWEFELPKEEKE